MTTAIMQKARHSSFWLAVLNMAMPFVVPFNRGHGIRIVQLENGRVMALLPYRKRNQNHIGGIHACAMATVAEYTSGFCLLNLLDAKTYRLIMKGFEIEFHYQGKMDAFAEYQLSEADLRTLVLEPLEQESKIELKCPVQVHDREGNHLATAEIIWQIKKWEAVKTE